MKLEELVLIADDIFEKDRLFRNQISKIPLAELTKLSYHDMYPIYKIGMTSKQSEKFIEHWVAEQLNMTKKSAKHSNNNIDGFDLGDLIFGDTLIPGKNNIELKVSFENNNIGGGQLRFWEPIAGYLFMKAWNRNLVEYFYLTKSELLDEIKLRAQIPKTKGKKFYTIFGVSQGSGTLKNCDNTQRLQILQDNLDQKRRDQICWAFNTKSELTLYIKNDKITIQEKFTI